MSGNANALMRAKTQMDTLNRNASYDYVNPQPAVPLKIAQLYYNVLSANDIRRLSVLSCKRVARTKSDFSINDKRLGVCDRSYLCETCGLSQAECVGHPGHIELDTAPVFHLGYFTAVLRICRTVCKTCAHVLLTDEEKEYYRRKLNYRAPAVRPTGRFAPKPGLDPLARIALTKSIQEDAYKTRICINCHGTNGAVRRVRPLKIIHEKFSVALRANEASEDGAAMLADALKFASELNPDVAAGVQYAVDILDPVRVRDLFNAIPPEDICLLGLDSGVRPVDLLIEAMSVPPISCRPSGPSSIGNGVREDELTGQYHDILLSIDSLKEGTFLAGSGNVSGVGQVAAQQSAADPQRHAEMWEMLQTKAARLLDGTLPGFPARLRTDCKSFAQRMKGKHGRFRGNLSGKRVDFSGRSVISPDPNLRIDEIAIPLRVARMLTYPQRVYQHNLEQMRAMVRNGPHCHPGAITVTFTRDNTCKGLLLQRDRDAHAEKLAIGDMVERHMISGDLVLFNRQPSLHRISMMCHKARVLPYRTLRFNECCCSPYNADFDGDEMNIHLVQTEEARAEARTLMLTARNIITAKNGEPIIACIQDFLTAAYLATAKDIFVDRSMMAQCISYWLKKEDYARPNRVRHDDDDDEEESPSTKKIQNHLVSFLPFPALMKPRELWTGKQMFEAILQTGPYMTEIKEQRVQELDAEEEEETAAVTSSSSVKKKAATNSITVTKKNTKKKLSAKDDPRQVGRIQLEGLNMEAGAKFYRGHPHRHYCPDDGYVCFNNGVFISGRLDKKILGGGAKDGLFARLHHARGGLESGGDYVALVMSRMAQFTARYLMNFGFSLGLGDVTPTKELQQSKQSVLDVSFARCAEIVAMAEAGKLEPLPGMTMHLTLEAKLNEVLSKIRETLGNGAVNDLDDRSNAPLIMAQSGSKGSNLNIAQMIACVGQQTVRGNRIRNAFIERSLPHYQRFAEHPEARGFVANSFYTSLKPTEFFFHTMAGREGLVDTAVKTAETGYIYRRLMKAMEDLSIKYDYTVRNSKNDIIQLQYGDDRLDPQLMEGNNGTPVNFPSCWLEVVKSAKELRIRSPESSIGDPEEAKKFIRDFVNFDDGKSSKNSNKKVVVDAPLPSSETAEVAPNSITLSSEPRYFAVANSGFFKNCSSRFKSDVIAFLDARIKEQQAVRAKLGISSSTIGSEEDEALKEIWQTRVIPITKEVLITFLVTCGRKYQGKMCEPGTSCGAIAAQSVGEPSTQMTLRTFHFAGVASMSITQGVPRLVEIINANKQIATPIITAPLVINHLNASISAGNMTLEEAERSATLLAVNVKAQVERVLLKEITMEIVEVLTPSAIYLRIKLNRRLISDLQLDITAAEVKERILAVARRPMSPLRKLTTQHLQVQSVDVLNVAPPLNLSSMATSPNANQDETTFTVFSLKQLLNALPEISVGGIPGVNRAIIARRRNKIMSPDGSGKQVEQMECDLLAEGAELLNIMNLPGVDGRRVRSNHIAVTEQVLGIEAARSTIISEIQAIMKAYALSIDIRHVFLLADVMTYRGVVLGITRYGIQKMNNGVLTMASFERTTEHLYNAAMYQRSDTNLSVSESIIVGNPVPLGSNSFRLLFDEKAGGGGHLENTVRGGQNRQSLVPLANDFNLF